MSAVMIGSVGQDDQRFPLLPDLRQDTQAIDYSIMETCACCVFHLANGLCNFRAMVRWPHDQFIVAREGHEEHFVIVRHWCDELPDRLLRFGLPRSDAKTGID